MDLKPYVGTIITIATILTTFAFGYGAINTKVEANEEKLKTVVYQNEFKAVLDGQERLNANMNKKMDKIEAKLDRLIERK